LAWGIASTVAEAGAELSLTYQGDALKKRVEPLAAELNARVAGHCDVTEPATMDAVFDGIEKNWGALDFLVHAVAFSDKDELTGRYVDTTEANFMKTLQISCYSLTALAQRATKLMPSGGSILTLTYYGSEKVMPHYNVMVSQKLRWKRACATLRSTSAARASASMPSPPGRSRRSQHPESATFDTS
jgi:enoyl-[acyl-carrier protein] reductase I